MLSFGLSAVGSALASILVSGLDGVIYMLLSMSYRIFTYICRIDLFSTTSGYNIYQTFTSRIYQVIGIITVFVVSYQLLLFIINPDGDSGKKTSTLVKDIVFSVVGVIIAPLIFHYMSVVQAHIVEDNTIYNIVLGTSSNVSSADDLAGIVLTSLYHPKGMSYSDFYDSNGPKANACDGKNGGKNESTYDNCNDWVTALSEWKGDQPDATAIWNITGDGNLRKRIGNDGGNDYMWVFTSLVGALVIFLICSYAIDVASRAVKLGVLEIIAPIPILIRMVNKEWFDNWIKEVGKTYADLFVRIAILAFVVLMCNLVPDFLSAIVESVKNAGEEVGAPYVCIITIILIIGLLMFAKGAIGMFKAIFTGGFLAGLNFNPFATAKTVGKGARVVGKGAQATIQHGYGAFAGAKYAFKNRRKAPTGATGREKLKTRWGNVLGVGGGFAHGAVNGYKGRVKTHEAVQKRNALLDNNKSPIKESIKDFGKNAGQFAIDAGRSVAGFDTRYDATKAQLDENVKELEPIKNAINTYKTAKDSLKSEVEKKVTDRNSGMRANLGADFGDTSMNYFEMQNKIDAEKSKSNYDAEKVSRMVRKAEAFKKGVVNNSMDALLQHKDYGDVARNIVYKDERGATRTMLMTGFDTGAYDKLKNSSSVSISVDKMRDANKTITSIKANKDGAYSYDRSVGKEVDSTDRVSDLDKNVNAASNAIDETEYRAASFEMNENNHKKSSDQIHNIQNHINGGGAKPGGISGTASGGNK